MSETLCVSMSIQGKRLVFKDGAENTGVVGCLLVFDTYENAKNYSKTAEVSKIHILENERLEDNDDKRQQTEDK